MHFIQHLTLLVTTSSPSVLFTTVMAYTFYKIAQVQGAVDVNRYLFWGVGFSVASGLIVSSVESAMCTSPAVKYYCPVVTGRGVISLVCILVNLYFGICVWILVRSMKPGARKNAVSSFASRIWFYAGWVAVSRVGYIGITLASGTLSLDFYDATHTRAINVFSTLANLMWLPTGAGFAVYYLYTHPAEYAYFLDVLCCGRNDATFLPSDLHELYNDIIITLKNWFCCLSYGSGKSDASQSSRYRNVSNDRSPFTAEASSAGRKGSRTRSAESLRADTRPSILIGPGTGIGLDDKHTLTNPILDHSNSTVHDTLRGSRMSLQASVGSTGVRHDANRAALSIGSAIDEDLDYRQDSASNEQRQSSANSGFHSRGHSTMQSPGSSGRLLDDGENDLLHACCCDDDQAPTLEPHISSPTNPTVLSNSFLSNPVRASDSTLSVSIGPSLGRMEDRDSAQHKAITKSIVHMEI